LISVDQENLLPRRLPLAMRRVDDLVQHADLGLEHPNIVAVGDHLILDVGGIADDHQMPIMRLTHLLTWRSTSWMRSVLASDRLSDMTW